MTSVIDGGGHMDSNPEPNRNNRQENKSTTTNQ